MSRAPSNAKMAAQGAKPDDGSEATKPSNPNPELSVGASQTGSDTIGGSSNNDTVTGGDAENRDQSVDTVTGAGLRQDTDLQGHASYEARAAREVGEGPAAATLGVNTATGLGSPPAESPGFSPEPAENTGDADSDKVPFTQAVQRLVPPDQGHPMAQALGVITNIPPGSAPAQIDPHAVVGAGAVSRSATDLPADSE